MYVEVAEPLDKEDCAIKGELNNEIVRIRERRRFYLRILMNEATKKEVSLEK